jgi:predicted RNase H-like nuclease
VANLGKKNRRSKVPIDAKLLIGNYTGTSIKSTSTVKNLRPYEARVYANG